MEAAGGCFDPKTKRQNRRALAQTLSAAEPLHHLEQVPNPVVEEAVIQAQNENFPMKLIPCEAADVARREECLSARRTFELPQLQACAGQGAAALALGAYARPDDRVCAVVIISPHLAQSATPPSPRLSAVSFLVIITDYQ
jgi:hypothetical protein